MKNGHMVEETLENSDLYFKAEEEGWSTFCKGAAVTLQPIGESSVNVCAKTGVFATGETDTALMALMNHLGGWIQKVGVYGFSPDGEVILLGDVLAAIETSDLLRRVPGVRERFWDMFVADAFIKNPDRNNGNWGVLMTAPMTYELAPVYDMGSSLFSKRSPSVAAHRLGDEEAEREDAFGTNVSCYRLPDGEGGSVAIHPFEYMAKTSNPDLTAAIKRFAAAVDMSAIDALIDSVPEEAYGIVLLSDSMRAEHKRLLRKRLEEGILPLL